MYHILLLMVQLDCWLVVQVWWWLRLLVLELVASLLEE
jgi:hypothetical protein